jgi:hypothetical protein
MDKEHSLCHFEPDYGAHPASYPVGMEDLGSFSEGKVAGT